jgi:hypothetical protein
LAELTLGLTVCFFIFRKLWVAKVLIELAFDLAGFIYDKSVWTLRQILAELTFGLTVCFIFRKLWVAMVLAELAFGW